MNLVLHQFRFDVRAFRIALGLWAAVLLLSLASNLGWLSSVSGQSVLQNNGVPSFWTQAVLVVLWAVGLILPSLVVLTDSPAKTDAFLATRPLPKSDLYTAKLLFLVLLIVLPLVLQEVCYLLLNHLPFGLVIHGALERLLWSILIITLCTIFAALWRDAKEWVAGLAATLVVGWVSAALLSEILEQYVTHEMVQGATPTIVYLGYAVVAFAVLAALNYRYRWPVFWRGLAAVLIFVAGIPIVEYWPWDFFPAKPSDPAAASAIAANLPFRVPPRDFHITCTDKPDSNSKLNIQLSVKPVMESLPAGVSINWVCQRSELVPASGMALSCKGRSTPEMPRYGMMHTATEARNIARALGPDTLISTQNGGSIQPDSSTSAGMFEAPDSLLPAQCVLKADFSGDIWQKEVVATLPWRPGATSTDATGRWKILEASRGTPNNPAPAGSALEREQIALDTTGDRTLSVPDYYFSDYDFVLYDETNQVAELTSNPTYSNLKIATETAYPRLFLTLYFPGNNSVGLTPKRGNAPALKLVILRKKFLGTLQRHWESPSFTLDDFFNSTFHMTQPSQSEQISTAEFNQRFAAITPPPPQPTRVDTGLYLTDVLRLVLASNSRVPDGHPMMAQLARLVPAHLEVFLNGVPVTDGWCRDVLLRALEQGAEERQKPEIIAALHRAPALAAVILQRGWMAGSQAALYQLLESPQPLDESDLKAIAWFDDPATYPGLLDEFAAHPDLSKYELLRTLPGIDASLDETVNRILNNWPRVVDGFGFAGEITVAARAGKQTAFDELYRICELDSVIGLRMQRGNNWVGSMRYVLTFPADLRDKLDADNRALSDWLAQHHAADFHYDPLRQRYMLNP